MQTHSRSIRSLSSRSLLQRGSLLALGPCLSAALGCASESVDLGGGTVAQGLRLGSRCADSLILDADVLVETQADLAALEGCQEINGDLAIQLFADADLSPLHDLRAVDGAFSIGQEAALAAFNGPLDDVEALIEQDAELLANGWLDSLTGLESLARVGALSILGTSVSDLSVLEQLRIVGGPVARAYSLGAAPTGSLYIAANPNLVDLTGLENVRGVDSLAVIDNPSLVSLSGFVPEASITAVSLSNDPLLTDLGALSPLVHVINLGLVSLGVTDLSAFSTLEIADFLSVEANSALVDASALENLLGVSSVNFSGNAVLQRLPTSARWLRVPDQIVIENNPELESLELEFNALADSRIVGDVARPLASQVVSIENNARLRSVSIPAIESNTVAGLTSVEFFSLRGNPALSSVDFGGLRRAGLLSIANNQSLASITLGALDRVEDLEVTDNPQLSNAVFDDVATFERTLSGNLP